MSLILHIETATEVCSVALAREGKLLIERQSSDSYRHARELTLLIEALLAETEIRPADLDAVAVSAGPGSFTGLRIGTSVAKGICFALDKHLITVDTLQSLAGAMQQAAGEGTLLCPMIDARRMEVYTRLFHRDLSTVWEQRALIVTSEVFDSFLQNGQSVLLGGNGAAKCMPLFTGKAVVNADIACSAAHLVPLAYSAFVENNFADTAYFSPNYLKAPNITTPKRKGI